MIATAVLAAVAGVLVAARGHARRAVTVGVPGVIAQPPVLFGVPARGVRTNLVIGGEYLWRLETGRPQQVLSGLLANGRSTLLAGSGAAVSQIEPVAGGVIAVISYAVQATDGSRGVVVSCLDPGRRHAPGRLPR